MAVSYKKLWKLLIDKEMNEEINKGLVEEFVDDVVN